MAPKPWRVTYVLRAREGKYLHWEGRNESRSKLDEVYISRLYRAFKREEIADDDDNNQINCNAKFYEHGLWLVRSLKV